MAPERAQGWRGIGGRVRASRERLGWTREQLAVESGMSWSAIAQIESGRRKNLRPGTLSALARALGVSVDYLIDGGAETPVMVSHQALVYEGDDAFVEAATRFATEGLDRSEPVMVVVAKEKRAKLRKSLGRISNRVAMDDSGTWYADPALASSSYARFISESIAAGAPWVRIMGEFPLEGASRAEIRALMRYEALCNVLFAHAPVSVVCVYDAATVAPSVLRQVDHTHPETIRDGATHVNAGYREPAEYVLE